MATATQAAVKERPVIFSAESVRAILNGSKTQTRRVIYPQPADFVKSVEFCEESRDDSDHYPVRDAWVMCDGDEAFGHFRCPFGKPGDRLWVREAGMLSLDRDAFMYANAADRKLAPTAEPDSENRCRAWKSCSSIHMPRWASRLTLELTGVRAERLQSITDADAEAEGCENPTCASISIAPGFMREVYRGAWDYLNAKRGFGWDTNPWVWVIDFKHREGE